MCGSIACIANTIVVAVVLLRVFDLWAVVMSVGHAVIGLVAEAVAGDQVFRNRADPTIPSRRRISKTGDFHGYAKRLSGHRSDDSGVFIR